LPAPNTADRASLYQRLRGHLAVLKLHDTAEALPSVLDQAVAKNLSMTAALDRLLSLEVPATEARRLTGGCDSRACRHRPRWRTSTTTPPPV
jgi:hypothetical protein